MNADDELLFTQDGGPIRFVLHDSIRSNGAIEALTAKIVNHGGEVVPSDDDANIMLVNPLRPDVKIHLLQRAYDLLEDERSKIWIKEMSFVDECLQLGHFTMVHPAKKKLTGRPNGYRNPFTSEDEQNLCKYLARVLPSPGGRLGLGVYKELMSLAPQLSPTYEWATRHTAQSWREHYKKNRNRLEPRIQEIVAQREPNPKASLYENHRVNNDADEEIEEERWEEMELEADEVEAALSMPSPERRTSSKGKGKGRAIKMEDEEEEEEEEESGEENEVQVASTSQSMITAHPRAERRQNRPSTNDSRPSQTLVNKNKEPALQLVDNDVQGIRGLSNTPAPVQNLAPGSGEPSARSNPTIEAQPFLNTRSRARSRSASVEPPTKPPRKTRKVPVPKALSSLPEAEAEIHPEHESLFSDPEPPKHPGRSRGPHAATNIVDSRKRGRKEVSDIEEESDDGSVFDSTQSGRRKVVEAASPREHEDDSESEDDKQVREMVQGVSVEEVLARRVGRPKKKNKAAASVVSDISSAEMPVPGTRASAAKKQLEKASLGRSYYPIEGTKAAARAGGTRA
ncbi:hypothetical protein BDP27DRAFT_1327413 [Rhodocollybia butyracea]|uniref:DNA-binding protein RAP1 n=1 Tax=Rhodocollybia butyracea TaxID=206335 RepID=A0A9P5PTK4_9AGAR|nr:hypothetical protein BDP27DRAFT_1327413 [Rhodocollybia butyracea]